MNFLFLRKNNGLKLILKRRKDLQFLVLRWEIAPCTGLRRCNFRLIDNKSSLCAGLRVSHHFASSSVQHLHYEYENEMKWKPSSRQSEAWRDRIFPYAKKSIVSWMFKKPLNCYFSCKNNFLNQTWVLNKKINKK